MNRNDQYRRSRRDRYDRDYGRQSEQFSDSDYGYGDDDRNFGQMGEGNSRGSYGESDNDSYSGYGYGASQGRYSRQNDQRGQDHGGGDYGRHGGYAESGGSYGQDSSYSQRRGGDMSRGFGPSSYGSSGGSGSFTGNDFGGRDFAAGQGGYGAGRSSGGYGNYGAGGGYTSSGQGRGDWSSRGEGGRSSSSRDNDRGFFDRAGDEVASWFGDEDAARRRQMDHSGRGPTNYTRSDERILEDACDHLTDDRSVDAQNIQVTVDKGEVTLDGTVSSREQKRRAEDCVHDLSGVKHVQNNLRVQDRSSDWGRTDSDRTSQSDQSTYNRSDSTTGTLA